MIIRAGQGGVLEIGSSFVLHHRDFSIQVRRHGRYDHPNRYGKPGPMGFVVSHEPIRKLDEETKCAARALFRDMIAKGEMLVFDPTDPANLTVTREAGRNRFVYEGFSLRVIIPYFLLSRMGGVDIEGIFPAFSNGSGYFDNMHSHNIDVIETLHDLLKEAKRAIDLCYATFKRLEQGLEPELKDWQPRVPTISLLS